MTAAAVTGVSSPEPPDPPEPPDLTSAFSTPSTSVCVPVLTLTISDLDLKIQTFRKIDLNSQIFKETFLLKDVGLVILIVVFIRPLTAVDRSVSITSYHEAHPSLVFTMSPTTGSRSPPSLDPLILLLDTSLQVIDLKHSVSILLVSMMSFECYLVPCYGTLASVRFSAVCSLVSGFTPSNDSLKLLPHRLWQIRKETLVVSIFSVFLDCLSFVKYDCLPYIPFGLSGSVTGSSVPKIMYASMFVLFKGSSIWCFVASACDAELLIVKAASVAVSISGVRPVLVLSNSQSFISLLSTIGVEFRGLLSDIMCCLCVMFAPILWCYISLLCFAMVAADVLAGLALLLLDVNNFSSYGD
ncbi:uncharacterized protein LOC103875294 isoform X1 [Brassica rapa]|uniref:Uncharacterized protein n=1 Tax=Brassica campestris TaxID=3711 RepID=A0A8D9D8P7_BRACM|nr:uncharacterized protein LOC103875294 isoform X1 [Brassica rapa]CAG7872735.1 unnamed protein product [Brassica rapa]